MKERCAGALLLALCLFALAGCGGNAKGTEYAVYYCNQAAGRRPPWWRRSGCFPRTPSRWRGF